MAPGCRAVVFFAANPEYDQFPKGYVLNKTAYMPPKLRLPSTHEIVQLEGAYPQVGSPPVNDTAYGRDYFAGAYRMGHGGSCSHLTPPQSYWCQPDGESDDSNPAHFTIY